MFRVLANFLWFAGVVPGAALIALSTVKVFLFFAGLIVGTAATHNQTAVVGGWAAVITAFFVIVHGLTGSAEKLAGALEARCGRFFRRKQGQPKKA